MSQVAKFDLLSFSPDHHHAQTYQKQMGKPVPDDAVAIIAIGRSSRSGLSLDQANAIGIMKRSGREVVLDHSKTASAVLDIITANSSKF